MGRHSSRFRTPSAERAATMVEYALLVALLAIATIAGLGQIQDATRAKTEQSAAGISSQDIPPATGGAGAGGGGGGGGEGGGGGATTTTAAPTTPTEPTTPTTTAEPPTTAPATSIRTSWVGTRRTDRTSRTTRYWRALADLDVKNERGERLSNVTVTVGVRYREGGSWRNGSDLTGTTTAEGSLTFQSPEYRHSDVSRIEFRVKSATRPGMTWQSGSNTVEVNRP